MPSVRVPYSQSRSFDQLCKVIRESDGGEPLSAWDEETSSFGL